MPETMLKKLKQNIHPALRVCFVFAVVAGLLAHAYKLTNWLPNWDSLVFRYDPQNMLMLGRWFLPVVCAPGSFYDLPWLSGLSSVVIHALGAVCICHMFNVRKKINAALIGAMVVTFPTVTSVLTYNYVADGYAVSFLLACLSAVFLTQPKPRYILAVIALTLSVGIYQAYVTVTVMLLLCYLIRELLYSNTTALQTIVKCLKFLLCGVIGMVLYYLVLTFLLKITGTTLLDYQGASNAASLSGLDFAASLYVIKNTLQSFFFDFSQGVHVFPVLNVLIVVLCIVWYVVDIVCQKLPWQKWCLGLLLTLLLPFGSTALALINSTVDYHNLMKMGYCVFYLFFLLQYENAKPSRIKPWAVLGVACILIANQIVIANVSYHKLQIAYEKSYGTLLRIADRIEQTEGAQTCDRILVIGALENSKAYSATLPPEITGITDGLLLRADDEVVGQSVLCSALNDYCGTTYSFVFGEEKTALLAQDDVKSLKPFPAKNSIITKDSVIVIKLGPEE